jgi:transcription elongation GreA/GreB family factor
MNEWPGWFTEPVSTPPQTSAQYRRALLRRRLREVKELLVEVESVAKSDANDDLVKFALNKVVQIRRDVEDVEVMIGMDG